MLFCYWKHRSCLGFELGQGSSFWSIWVSYESKYWDVFGWPAGQSICPFCAAKTLKLDITRKLLNHFFSVPAILMAPLTSTILYHFHWPCPCRVGGGSKGQCNAKPTGFIFSHTFHLIGRKFDVMMKQFKLDILRLLFSKITWNKRKKLFILQTASKIFKVAMHLDAYEWIWFRLLYW